MNIKRRTFFKGSAAACVLLLPGIASAARIQGGRDAPASPTSPSIEKSIKAGFGGGFSVRSHTQSNGITYANIEHLDTRYLVASSNTLDWKIVSA